MWQTSGCALDAVRIPVWRTLSLLTAFDCPLSLVADIIHIGLRFVTAQGVPKSNADIRESNE